MWCRTCNIETSDKICPICKSETDEDLPVEIYWCSECKTPIVTEVNQADKGLCPICRSKTEYLSTDLRPVFPEERLLIELILGKEPNECKECSVWASNNRYYFDGKKYNIQNSLFSQLDADVIRMKLIENQTNNSYEFFNKYISNFIKANRFRYSYMVNEANEFIKKTSSNVEEEKIVISFSGGKDSTVVADLVIKALGNPNLVHIFGDTTLEFPTTLEYAERYRKSHLQAIFQVAKNYEQNFMLVCEDIGPPARMMRWCCSMFKTGPITRVLNSLYRDQKILTYYGIRKSESVSRSKYNRIEGDSESVKIQKQVVASPIFFWKDIDIWLYILTTGIDFNEAYRRGYDRVGCWCCPNNNLRAQFMSKIFMPDKSKEWRDFLISFASSIGKLDAEEYVDTGKWKARQGGNGLISAGDVKIKFTNCTSEEHAKIYKLKQEVNDEFIELFIPFGRIAPELGQKLLNETIILDIKTNVPIISIQPFGQEGYDYAVKIKTMNVADHDDLQRMIAYQVRKFNACRKCLKCESLCKAGAISIVGDRYSINADKCVHCKMCVNQKYLAGGCMMDKYLRTKDK